jgi:hypothetical protein
LESVCRSQAYRGFESLPLYKAFQRELGGFFDSDCFLELKGTKFVKRMVTGFVQDVAAVVYNREASMLFGQSTILNNANAAIILT